MVKKTYKYICTCGKSFKSDNQENIHCPDCKQKITLGWKVSVFRKSDISEDILIQRLTEYIDNKNLSSYEFDCGTLQSHDSYGNDNIILADWNEIPKRLNDWIDEKFNFECEWSENYSRCQCGKFFRVTPDSYQWQKNFLVYSQENHCRECVENEGIENYLDEYMNNYKKALPNWTHELIEKLGFVCMDNEDSESCKIFAIGWHPGQNDNPKEIIDDLYNEIDSEKIDYLFVIDSISQFDFHFSLFIREKERPE